MVMTSAIAFATIASKTAFVAILTLSLPLHGIGSLAKFVAIRISAGWHSIPLRRNGLIWLVLLIAVPKIMATGCPHCFGANPACTLDASGSGTCPYDAVPTRNRAIIAGTSSASLCLTNCILPRFLRCFERGELSTVTSLAKRPAPGTTIAIDTSAGKLTQTLSNLRAGLTSKGDIENAFFQAISTTTDAAKNAALRADMKLLMNIKTIGDESTTHEQNGLYTWLLAKVVAFITAGTFITTSVIVAASSSSVSSVHRAKVPCGKRWRRAIWLNGRRLGVQMVCKTGPSRVLLRLCRRRRWREVARGPEGLWQFFSRVKAGARTGYPPGFFSSYCVPSRGEGRLSASQSARVAPNPQFN